MTRTKGGSTAEKIEVVTAGNVVEDTQGKLTPEEFALKVGQEIGKHFDMGVLKDLILGAAEELGYEPKEVDDETIFAVWSAMPSEKKDTLLRKIGLVPTPGLFSSITGWHNIEHLRSRGWRNKVSGAMGIIYQGAAIGLGTYLGVDWYRNRA